MGTEIIMADRAKDKDGAKNKKRWKRAAYKKVITLLCIVIVAAAAVLGYEAVQTAIYQIRYGVSWSDVKTLKKQGGSAENILEHYDQYPEELLEMLSRNEDMLDFVLGYPEKKGQVFANDVGNVEKGTVPLLLQYDEGWGYGDYGSSCVAISGCAPACLSMVYAGLTGDNSVTPYTVARYADENGYYVAGQGTSWSLITKGCGHFGLQGTELPLSESKVFGALENGQPIICSMRPGDFTTTGHFIVLTGVRDGKITVNDPNSRERSGKLWDYDRLSGQINNLWAMTVE